MAHYNDSPEEAELRGEERTPAIESAPTIEKRMLERSQKMQDVSRPNLLDVKRPMGSQSLPKLFGSGVAIAKGLEVKINLGSGGGKMLFTRRF